MGVLAFDSEAVAALHRALSDAADELRDLHLDDPHALDARRLVGRALTAADSWLGTVRSIASCLVMESYTPVGDLRVDDLADAPWIALREAGYTLVGDPAGATIGDPRLAALAVAGRLGSTQLGELLSDAEISWLAASLPTMLSDPEGRRAFLGALGHDGLSLLSAWLGRRCTEESADGNVPGVHDIESIWRTLGAALAADRDANGAANGAADRAARSRAIPIEPLIAEVSPFAAAHMVGAMHLEGEELARLTRVICSRYLAEQPWADDPMSHRGPLPGDILFPLVAGDPVASVALATSAIGRFDVLFMTSNDLFPVGEIIRQATDAARVGPAGAGALLVPMLDHLMHHEIWGSGGDDLAFLGDAVAPYLPAFIPGGSIDWGWEATRAQLALTFVAGVDGTLDPLLTGGRALVDQGVVMSPGGRRESSLGEAGAVIGAILDAYQHSRIGRALDDKAAWTFYTSWLTTLSASVAAWAIPGGPIAEAVAGESMASLGRSLTTAAEEHGWFGAPQSDEAIVRDEASATDVGQAAAAAMAIGGVLAAAARPTGLRPPPQPGTPTPGNCVAAGYRAELDDWLDDARAAGMDPTTLELAGDVADGLLARQGAGARCSNKAYGGL